MGTQELCDVEWSGVRGILDLYGGVGDVEWVGGDWVCRSELEATMVPVCTCKGHPITLGGVGV